MRPEKYFREAAVTTPWNIIREIRLARANDYRHLTGHALPSIINRACLSAPSNRSHNKRISRPGEILNA